ncbi:MAG: family 10 glycosylhydrolase [Melioribacteraceae bacterium]|nr:family 10 glycosylhydrolase [Melioribacteraceae bacterium]
MKTALRIITLIIVTLTLTYSNINSQKREFRAFWVATVANLDWPSSINLSTEKQKEELIILFDELKDVNTNAVVFQIRTECDALYNSNYDPWSYYLTGRQGKAPDPYYDPLEFAIEEAHKRGMELHAWFNPYRADRSASGGYAQDNSHVTVQHPDWVLQSGELKFLDPGLPDVREYVLNVVMDVVNRYDVDGVHFDDYFYPYEGITSQDNYSWENFKRGFVSRSDWRRDNVNLLLRMISDSIQVVKPYVKFGMSPFGIWKSGMPIGIEGLSGYYDIYCDAIAWLNDQSIDYLTPQCYWPIGGGRDYISLTNWWADSVAAHNRHFYPGQGFWHQEVWASNEVPNQIRHNRSNDKIHGSVHFRARYLRENPKGITDSLKAYLYKNVALAPEMLWKDFIPPNPPQNLRFERLANTAVTGLVWDKPEDKPNDDSARFYVVYMNDDSDFNFDVLENPGNILDLIGVKSYVPDKSIDNTPALYIAVTALDRNNSESTVSNIVQLNAPDTPLLAYPSDGELNQPDTIILKWLYTSNAGSYLLQVAADSLFNDVILDQDGLIDSSYSVTGLYGQQTYYWRVKARNIIGESGFSETRTFTTGFPVVANLIYPPHETTGIDDYTEFKWNKVESATHYRLQIINSVLAWKDQLIILDIDNIEDTTYKLDEPLGLSELYSWRILAANDYGYSLPSSVFKFMITDVSGIARDDSFIPDTYQLYQNYPNPFNPETMMQFDLPESGHIRLTVYNMLGQEITIILNKTLSAGRYTVDFNAAGLPSGVYIYRLNVNNRVFTNKMMLVK